MQAISTQYTLHGEGGIPVWILLPALALAFWLALRWNRQERQGRRGRLSACLPWTLSLLLLLLAWVLYNPVLVKSITFEGARRIVAMVDVSRSMDLPLALPKLTDRLDLSALWQGTPLPGRPLAAGELARLVATLRAELPTQRAAVLALQAGREEGIPPGGDEFQLAERYDRWRTDTSAALGLALAAVQRELPEEADAAARLETIQILADRFVALPEGVESTSDLGAILSHLEALSEVASRAETCGWELQGAADAAWLSGPGAALATAAQAAAETTRGELARKLAGRLPAANTTVVWRSPRTTRLADSLRDALRLDGQAPISHLFLFSDGVEVADAEDVAALQRLPGEGIAFQVVGTDLPVAPQPDSAILDWSTAPVVVAGRAATIVCTVKPAPAIALTLQLLQGETILAESQAEMATDAPVALSLHYQAPEPGRHVFRLRLTAEPDAVPGNNQVVFVQQSADRLPELLLIDDVPDWDSAYLELAARRAGLGLRQVHAAGKPPERGSFSNAVPQTPDQWQRYAGIILRGAVFPGFAEADATMLRDLVVKEGRTLVLMGGGEDGWLRALAPAFGWAVDSETVDGQLGVPAESCHLPSMAMASDPEESRRRFAALPRPRLARTVPAQDAVLLADERGRPVGSLGFYGRGRVLLFALDGLAPLRLFAGAPVVDRWCDSLIAEAATPLFAGEALVTTYPPLPQRGRLAWLIAQTEEVAATVDGQPLALAVGLENRSLHWRPAGTDCRVVVGAEQLAMPVADNSGVELRFPEFRPDRLAALAAAGQGAYIPCHTANQRLSVIEPQTWQKVVTVVYRPGRQVGIFASLVLVAALHWVLRKLSGLAI